MAFLRESPRCTLQSSRPRSIAISLSFHSHSRLFLPPAVASVGEACVRAFAHVPHTSEHCFAIALKIKSHVSCAIRAAPFSSRNARGAFSHLRFPRTSSLEDLAERRDGERVIGMRNSPFQQGILLGLLARGASLRAAYVPRPVAGLQIVAGRKTDWRDRVNR